MSSIISEDVITQSMLKGLVEGFEQELTDILKKKADELIIETVTELSKRVKVHLETKENFIWDRRDISLTWCIKTNPETPEETDT